MRTAYRERRDHLLTALRPPFRRGRDQRRRRRPASVLAPAGRRARRRDGRGPRAAGRASGCIRCTSGNVCDPYRRGALSRRGSCSATPADAEADRARDRAPVGRGGRRAGWAPHRASATCWPGGRACRRAPSAGPSAGGAANRLHGFARNRLSRRRRRVGQHSRATTEVGVSAPMPVVTGLYQVSDQGPEPAADRRRSGSRPASRFRSTVSSPWRGPAPR